MLDISHISSLGRAANEHCYSGHIVAGRRRSNGCVNPFAAAAALVGGGGW